MRLTSDLEIPLAPPSAPTRASTFRVEIPPGVSLHHRGVERLVHPAARLEPIREEAGLPQLWDGQAEVAHLGSEQPLAVAVAVVGVIIRAVLMARGSNGSGGLGLHQILEAPAHNLRNQGASGGALHELSQLGGATMRKGHGLCSVWC